jgi:hypothetical protein
MKMAKKEPRSVNLSKVEKTSDGRLLSSNANAYMCENCPNVHLNLMDDEGTVFATLLMPPEEIIELGEALKRWQAGQGGRAH